MLDITELGVLQKKHPRAETSTEHLASLSFLHGPLRLPTQWRYFAQDFLPNGVTFPKYFAEHFKSLKQFMLSITYTKFSLGKVKKKKLLVETNTHISRLCCPESA